jgi:CBS domain containing-hemolysin-like protein
MLSVLVGEISDEFRQSQSDWIQQDDGTLLGKASLSVFSLERALGIDIEDHEVDTVGGLIHWKLERLPEEGERVDFGRFAIVVRKMRGPRIQLVKVIPVGGTESETAEAAAR